MSGFAEVVQREDGTYAVVTFRDGYEQVLGTFDTESEAQSWMLEADRSGSDLGIQKPGGRQGL